MASIGSITTRIIKDGLVFNMDAANRASTIPSTSILKTFNTIDLSQSGSIVTDATWANGTPPTFNFDGTDGYISLPNSIPPRFVKTSNASEGGQFKPWSVGIWAKFTAANQNFLQFVFGGEAGVYTFQLAYYSSKVHFGHRYTILREETNSTAIDINEWNYIFLTKDGNISSSDSYKLYINGNNIDHTTSAHWGTNNTGKNDLGRSFTTEFTTGDISSLHMYTKALSASEVLHNYNALKGRFGL